MACSHTTCKLSVSANAERSVRSARWVPEAKRESCGSIALAIIRLLQL